MMARKTQLVTTWFEEKMVHSTTVHRSVVLARRRRKITPFEAGAGVPPAGAAGEPGGVGRAEGSGLADGTGNEFPKPRAG